LLHRVQGAREVSGSEVEGVGVGESLWHEAELGDIEIAEALAKLESGLAPEICELPGDAVGVLV